MNEIILKAQAELHDIELREWVSKMQVQIETLNERTKNHTIKIKELENILKKK